MIGRQIGDYLIQDRLGAGGMGEVYKALELKLNRVVALKLLNEKLSGDANFVARFLREAELAARLSHPNIATIFAAGMSGGVRFLAMEYLPGETLAARLRRYRPTPAECCAWGAQLADGLAAAHELGLVHRDIKPANLMLLPDGRLKILDFGLARRATPENPGHEDSSSPTRGMADQDYTAQGEILGTAAYMSPEQARGEPLDGRSDIFCAGIVLYEMLTGRHPFRGRSTADTFASLLHVNPDFSELELDPLTAEPARITAHALAKAPEERYARADELALELREAVRHISEPGYLAEPLSHSVGRRHSGAMTPARGNPAAFAGSWWARSAWGITLALALFAGLAGLAAAGGWRLGRASREKPRPAPRVRLLTRDATIKETAVLSPDGERLAFNSTLDGSYQLFVRSLAGTEVVQLTHGEGSDERPAFSPDGATLAFQREVQGLGVHELRLIPALGGESRSVADHFDLQGWFPDGQALLASRCRPEPGLYRVPIARGAPEPLLRLTPDACGQLAAAALAPDGTLHYQLNGEPDAGAGLYEKKPGASAKTSAETSAETGAGERILAIGNVFTTRLDHGPNGTPVYFSASNTEGNISSIMTLDLPSRRLTNLTLSSALLQFPSVDRSGRRLVYMSWDETNTIGLIDISGALPAQDPKLLHLTGGAVDDEQPAFSPDGRRVAYVSDVDGAYNLWMSYLDPGPGGGVAHPVQITFGGDHYYAPIFSRDATEIYCFSNRGKRAGLYAAPVAGGPLRLISDGLPIENYVTRSATPDLSPDGKSLVFAVRTGPREYAVEIIELATGVRRRLGAAAGRGPRFAPDGRHIYAIGRYPETTSARAADEPPLRLWRFDLTGKPEPVFTFPHNAINRYTALSRDGRWFYYFAEIPLGGHNWQVWRADLGGKTPPMPITRLQDTPPRFGFALSPDGLHLAASLNRVNSNVMLVETEEEKK